MTTVGKIIRNIEAGKYSDMYSLKSDIDYTEDNHIINYEDLADLDEEGIDEHIERAR